MDHLFDFSLCRHLEINVRVHDYFSRVRLPKYCALNIWVDFRKPNPKHSRYARIAWLYERGVAALE
jgi:hypothetical protein